MLVDLSVARRYGAHVSISMFYEWYSTSHAVLHTLWAMNLPEPGFAGAPDVRQRA